MAAARRARIIPTDLAQAVQGRLEAAGKAYARTNAGKLLSRPTFSDVPGQYLLTGFAVCSECGGSFVADARVHGKAANRRLVRYYGCSFHRRRGASVCANSVGIRQELLDAEILRAIAEVLDERILDRAVDKALARLRAGKEQHIDRKTQIDRELSLIESKMNRLLDALAEGGAPRDEVVSRMNVEKKRKTSLLDELAGLSQVRMVSAHDANALKRQLRERVSDVKSLLRQNTVQARQMLRKLLAGKLAMEPVADANGRGYRFRGELSLGRLLTGETLIGVREELVTPAGFEPAISTLKGSRPGPG